MSEAIRRVRASAPVRIADVGGWTDTWFARHGAVCHIGVGPGVDVEATVSAASPPKRPVRIIAPDLGEDYWCGPSPEHGWARPEPGRHPLLEHAVAAAIVDDPPLGSVTVTIRSRVPPGASLGTSASVLVALGAALGALHDEAMAIHPAGSAAERTRLAHWAHRVETGRAGRQAGVQDQWAAAFGGASLLRIDPYPEVRQSTIPLGPAIRELLDTRTVTVCFGAHDSSAVHSRVIAHLASPHPRSSEARDRLDHLRTLAVEAADALEVDDPDRWAAILIRSTDVQADLHPGLVGAAHRRAIELARRHGAIGWKVNGAGGEGGSLTAVFGSAPSSRDFMATLATELPVATPLTLTPREGVTVSLDTSDG